MNPAWTSAEDEPLQSTAIWLDGLFTLVNYWGRKIESPDKADPRISE